MDKIMRWERLTHKEREKIIKDFFPDMKYKTIYSYACQRKIENLPMFVREKINSFPPPFSLLCRIKNRIKKLFILY